VVVLEGLGDEVEDLVDVDEAVEVDRLVAIVDAVESNVEVADTDAVGLAE
jgi:hypothetical protein